MENLYLISDPTFSNSIDDGQNISPGEDQKASIIFGNKILFQYEINADSIDSINPNEEHKPKTPPQIIQSPPKVPSYYEFERTSKKTIQRRFNDTQELKSKMTNLLREDVINFKHVSVRYFQSPHKKTIQINESMLTIEFINLALKEYKKEASFDQNLLKYPNYSLAYQLKGFEDYFDCEDFNFRRPIEKAETTIQHRAQQKVINRSLEDFGLDSFSEQSIDNQQVYIGLESKLQYSLVELVPITEFGYFTLDLEIVKITNEQFPNLIIILIENSENNTIFHIRLDPNQLVEDCFNDQKIITHFKKSDYQLCLKYECVNFNTEPLNLKMPIHWLPIHWLVLKPKIDVTLNTSFCTLTQNPIIENLQISMRQRMYNYQEFKLFKIDGSSKNLIILGIDYFDIYYHYLHEKLPFSIWKVAKTFFNLFSEHDCVPHKSRRIPIRQVVAIQIIDQSSLQISYMKDQDYQKILKLIPMQFKENNQNEVSQKQFLELYQKLQFLANLRLIETQSYRKA